MNICKRFIEYVKAQNVSDMEFMQWINGRTDEGYTPIHFAAFKGSLVTMIIYALLYYFNRSL